MVLEILESIRYSLKSKRTVRTLRRGREEHKPRLITTEHNDMNEKDVDTRPTNEEKRDAENLITRDMLYPQIDVDTKWDNVWNVREFIRNLSELNLEMYVGNEVTSDFDFEVRKARVASALSAFTGIAFEDAKDRLTYFGMRNICDDKVNEERAEKIRMALKSPSMNAALLQRIDNLKIDEDSCSVFLHDLICCRYNITKVMSNNMLEGTEAMYLAKYKIKAIYSPMIQPAIDEIDSILILLLGDAFSKSFSEKELIEHYNYPTVTDSTLREWCWMNY